jgi:uncharacterized membrane protein
MRRNWTALALGGSLILNAFLVGIIVAESWRGHHDRRLPRYAGFELRRMADQLPDEAVADIAAKLNALAPAISDRLDRIRAARRDIARLTAEPEPDRAAIDARLAELRAESLAMQEAVQKATYDAVLALPPGVRTRLAEAHPER